MILYREFDASYLEEVKAIYAAEQWNAYLKDDVRLKRAFDNSLFILGAFDNAALVGFIRCVGDGEHIVLIQDLIVKPEYQKKGIGTALLRTAWEKYAHVRMFHVVTDLEDTVDNHFYRSFGMKKLEEGHMVSYFR